MAGRVASSVLGPAGPQAQAIAGLWWLMLAICGTIFLVVLALLLVAIVRRRGEEPERRPGAPAAERRRRAAVTVGASATAAILVIFLLASISTGRTASPEEDPGGELTIDLYGHQWWWEVRYPAFPPSDSALTANEIHVPVGRMVLLRATSRDVIHSFWAPNVDGKKDLIPGRWTLTRFRVDRPGVFRGQCAEYCGDQHAHMAFLVVAEPEPDFEAWLAAQRASAVESAGAVEDRGRLLFQASSCPICHAIRGTPAAGSLGPDLTHFGGRATIGAATLANDPAHLAGWVLDPQKIKPGAAMPPNALSGPDAAALAAYLESLR
ncbi:MAG TPA: cytochrome c oxidase subunit II [Thermoanaerobaculia bacterium]|nr:cytochrome c oxidase subunit II [Thermoanaerobaculia bacterium]